MQRFCSSINSNKNQFRAQACLLADISQVLYRIHNAGCEVDFLWVPAYMGVEGNEVAGELSKEEHRKKDE